MVMAAYDLSITRMVMAAYDLSMTRVRPGHGMATVCLCQCYRLDIFWLKSSFCGKNLAADLKTFVSFKNANPRFHIFFLSQKGVFAHI